MPDGSLFANRLVNIFKRQWIRTILPAGPVPGKDPRRDGPEVYLRVAQQQAAVSLRSTQGIDGRDVHSHETMPFIPASRTPPPVHCGFNQSCTDWILMIVLKFLQILRHVFNRKIIIPRLPERIVYWNRLAEAGQKLLDRLVRIIRRLLFPLLQERGELTGLHKLKQNVNMIWHDDKPMAVSLE